MSHLPSHNLRRAATRLFITVCLLLVLIVALCGLAVLAFGSRYADCIYPGVSILGVDVGGLTGLQATARLQADLADEGGPLLHLQGPGQAWVVSAQDIGGALDLQASVLAALRLGRSGVFVDDWIARAHLVWWGYDLTPPFTLDVGPSLVFLRHIARYLAHPARAPDLVVAGLAPQENDAAIGSEMDIAAAQAAIANAVASELPPSSWGAQSRVWPPRWERSSVPRPTAPITVSLSFADVAPNSLGTADAADDVAALLAGPLLITCDTSAAHPGAPSGSNVRAWAIDQATLASWLSLPAAAGDRGPRLRAQIDQAPIEHLVQQIADELARTPRDGRYAYDAAKQQLISLSDERYGLGLDRDLAVAAISQACFAPEHAVALPVRVIPPRVTRAELEALLPLTLISEGQSSFTDSEASRLLNIRTATARFHGVVVPPQSAFSFLQVLEQVTVATGYSLAWVILGSQTVLGPGGGVCQVSTTCFRAAFLGGYPILERWPHSYRVGWYEPPLGLDAAVFEPTTDMRFQNDSDSPLLIQTETNLEAQTLHFRFYGVAPGRTVRIEGPETSNPVTAGEPIIEVDPSLAPGQRLLVERAHDGIDATIYRIIEQDGQIISREALPSHYQAWPARYRVGPQPQPTPAPEAASS